MGKNVCWLCKDAAFLQVQQGRKQIAVATSSCFRLFVLSLWLLWVSWQPLLIHWVGLYLLFQS